jgi:hypothetical protein
MFSSDNQPQLQAGAAESPVGTGNLVVNDPRRQEVLAGSEIFTY